MTSPPAPPLPGMELLGDMQPTRGNVLWLARDAGGSGKVLKVYRRRRAPLPDVLESALQRVFERKLGTTPAARCATERELLDLWAACGVEVPCRHDDPLPPGVGPHALWFEYCPGPLLSHVVHDDGRPWSERLDLVRRFARDLGRRNALALERDDPRLCHEHATLNHVIVCGDRLVHFDLEGGFARGAHTLDALGLELAGYLRSLGKLTGDRFDEALRAFVESHGDPELLQRAANRAVHGRSPSRVLRRLRDRKKRGAHGKTWVMGRLLDALRSS